MAGSVRCSAIRHTLSAVSDSTASFNQAIKSPILHVTPTHCPQQGMIQGISRSYPLPPRTACHGVRSQLVLLHSGERAIRRRVEKIGSTMNWTLYRLKPGATTQTICRPGVSGKA